MRLVKRHSHAVSGLNVLDGLSSTGKQYCCSTSVYSFERAMLSVHRLGRRSISASSFFACLFHEKVVIGGRHEDAIDMLL